MKCDINVLSVMIEGKDFIHLFLVFELYSITSSTAFSEYFCEMGLSDNKASFVANTLCKNNLDK